LPGAELSGGEADECVDRDEVEVIPPDRVERLRGAVPERGGVATGAVST
jgi:hypothetical protein